MATLSQYLLPVEVLTAAQGVEVEYNDVNLKPPAESFDVWFKDNNEVGAAVPMPT